ncbi:CAP domain-containing protein [Nocardioides panacisoli]|uniref:CAP domain-containing protein n=1 Tax=Nocardioides panacisoli TaxID=627624 RepID=UPI0031CF7F1A
MTLAPDEQRDLGVIDLDDGMNLRRSPSALDVTDPAVVTRSWKQDVRGSSRTPSPRIHGCKVARQPERVLRKVAGVINWYRGMAGLDPVVLAPRLNRLAQRSSVIQSYLRSEPLSHDPPRSTRCWSRAGAEAAGRSDLAMGWTGGSAVNAYMSDYGVPSVGHRTPILNPTATAFGSGDAGQYNSLYVYGPNSQKASRPPWISWPSAGYFPYGVTPSTWSLQTSRADVDLRGARVTLTLSTGQRIRALDQTGDTNMLLWTLSASPRRHHDTTVVDVKVSGIKWRGVTQPPLVYTVRILDLSW